MEAQTPGDNAGDEVDAKLAEVQDALESMLSKKSLVKDQFLAGNMNPQMYIPISTLLEHEKLKIAGATEALIVAAATRSAKLGIDEGQSMVRPLLKSKRNVVILREVPEGITESDIFELFVGAPHADKIVHVKPEVNNTWFVKFNLDSGTEEVVLWLRTQQLKGVPVNAAIKSEHFLRSFYPLHQAAGGAMGGATMMYPPVMGDQGLPMELVGMPGMPMQMPPPPPPLQEGMQTAGFWQPWGQRYQAPPLVFTSATTLAESSKPELVEELPPLDFLADFEDADAGGKSKGGKGGGWKGGGGGKGKWNSGKEWSKGGWSSWGGKDWGGGKDWNASGGGWSSGGKGGGGGFGGGGGWAGGGKAAQSSESYAGDASYGGCGGGDWYAASVGKGGDKWAPAENRPRRKGGKGSEGSGKPAEALSGSKFANMGSVYKHDARTYTREDFERIRQVVNKENLTRPKALAETLGADLPVLNEAPVLDPIK